MQQYTVPDFFINNIITATGCFYLPCHWNKSLELWAFRKRKEKKNFGGVELCICVFRIQSLL